MLHLLATVVRHVRDAVRRPALFARYVVVSMINVVNHQALLQLALQWWGFSGGWANAFAGLVAVIPAYFLSRSWVWRVTGPSSVRSEMGPFWLIALAGLATSTALAEAADRLFAEPWLVSAGSLTGYFIVWVAKFIILNVLFARSRGDRSGAAVGEERASV